MFAGIPVEYAVFGQCSHTVADLYYDENIQGSSYHDPTTDCHCTVLNPNTFVCNTLCNDTVGKAKPTELAQEQVWMEHTEPMQSVTATALGVLKENVQSVRMTGAAIFTENPPARIIVIPAVQHAAAENVISVQKPFSDVQDVTAQNVSITDALPVLISVTQDVLPAVLDVARAVLLSGSLTQQDLLPAVYAVSFPWITVI